MSDIKQNKFGFLTPEDYVQVNAPHLRMNKEILNDFKRNHLEAPQGPMTVLDFGCGTGETTKGMSNGTLLPAGSVQSVLGLDLSPTMIDYCNKQHVGTDSFTESCKLKFQPFDITNDKQRVELQEELHGNVDLVTSFSTMHWVPRQIETLKFFKSVLKPTGCMILFVCADHSKQHFARQAFEKLQSDMPNLMKGIKYTHEDFRYEDSGKWQSKIDGRILPEDYQKLLEKCGFQCLEFEPTVARYRIGEAQAVKYMRHKVIPSYKSREVEAACTSMSMGLFDSLEKYNEFSDAFEREALRQHSSCDDEPRAYDVIFTNLKIVARPATD